MSLLALSLLVTGFQGLGHSGALSNIIIPPSSEVKQLPFWEYNHTNIEYLGGAIPGPVSGLPPLLAENAKHGPFAAFQSAAPFEPYQIRGFYGVTGNGSGVICIVDAYNYPTALADFNFFATQFGLPTEPSTTATSSANQVFQVVYANSSGGTTTTPPANNSSWNGEEALDIEWAHAMAPSAKIILVEAINSGNDLYEAVLTAASMAGVREISMSWGGSDSSGEQSYDGTYFGSRAIQYFAASGDTGAEVIYPSASPNVISCGGTSITVNGSSYVSETAWADGGGGPSAYEPIPSYQTGLKAYNSSGTQVAITGRATPDIAAVADPNTGVYVYQAGNWYQVGGTSVATPVLAGIHNSSTTIHRSSEWFWIYENGGLFHDITTGSNGFKSGSGYDYTTGMGTPKTGNSL